MSYRRRLERLARDGYRWWLDRAFYVAVNAGINFGVETVNYILTFPTVVLTKTLNMTFSTGSFTYTGNDVSFRRGYIISMSALAFTYTGNDINFISPLSATAAPDSTTGQENEIIPTTVTSDPVVVTPFGGVAPYTYDWEYVSGDAGIAADSDTSATTTFSATVNCGGVPVTGVWRCKVTDSAPTVVYSNNVDISLVNIGTCA